MWNGYRIGKAMDERFGYCKECRNKHLCKRCYRGSCFEHLTLQVVYIKGRQVKGLWQGSTPCCLQLFMFHFNID